MDDSQQHKVGAKTELFAPWWLYGSAISVLVIVGVRLWTNQFLHFQILDILGLVWAIAMLAKSFIVVGSTNAWVIGIYGLYWKRIPLADVTNVVCSPKESWGKLITSRLELAIGKSDVLGISMGSVSASWAAGRYIRAMAESIQNGSPAPSVKETGGRGLLLPEGVLPGDSRWRGPFITGVLAFTAISLLVLYHIS